MALLFEDAAKAKNAIMASQQKEIAKLYDDWANDIADRAKFYSHKTNASAPLSERYYQELYKQMKATSKMVSDEVAGIIKGNMYTIADSVVTDNIKWLQSFGFSEDGLNAAFSYVPHDVVQMLITGQVYQGGWNLSQRIWSDNQQTQKDIYQIMARGLAENKSIYSIAKDLESYVKPSAAKAWNPILAMKNTKTGKIEYKRIYKSQVDYNAQRLARTLAQHTYQQSFIATTKDNPFITEYIWHSNGSRVCPLCASRDGMHFEKNELPMDHPNGMCVMEPVVAKDMVDQLANWFNSPDGTYPEIDAFAGNFGYQAQKVGTVQDFIAKYGTSTKSPSAWYNSLNQIQKAEAKALKDASGLSWNDWYEQNIYAGSTKAPATTAKTIKAFNEMQEKYLSPYGFSPTNMPKNFDDWSHKISYDQASEILQSMGTSWSDPHPYQQLMKYYNANLVTPGSVTQTINVAKAATKTTAKKATTAATKATASNAASKVDNAFDAAAWKESVRKNNLSEMGNWTDDWLSKITATEKNGVRTYTGNAYSDMNKYLRGQSQTTNYAKEIKACEKALSKASLPRETIVRRGSDYNMLDELGIGKITPQNKNNFIGAIVQDKGFVSTSPSPDGGFSGNIEYVIRLPQGSQAMYVAPISHFESEEELLINCGGKYMVEDVEFGSLGGVKKIYMTLKNLKGSK